MRGIKEVTLTFKLEEEVTPHIFLRKIGLACMKGGALRIGESVWYKNVGIKYEKDHGIPLGDIVIMTPKIQYIRKR